MKLQSRSELLESLRRQQEELQAAMEEEELDEEEEEDKHSQVDHVRSLSVHFSPGGRLRSVSTAVIFIFLWMFVAHTLEYCWFTLIYFYETLVNLCSFFSPLHCVQDSLEEELSTCNESVATEPSFIDENLVFNESKRVPFFKVRKRQKHLT